MKNCKSRLISDEIPFNYIYITLLVSAILPEYLAPFLTLSCFPVFKRHFSLTGQKVKMGTVGKVFLLFMCYSLLSSFWSLTPIYSAAISLLWMGMLLGSFFVSNMTTSERKLESFVSAFSIGGAVVGGIGFIQYVFLLCGVKVPNPLWSVLDGLIYKLMPFSIMDTATVWESSRAASTFDNPLICATYLLMALPIAVYGFTSGIKKHRKICFVSSILILGGIVGTTSRAALFAAIVSLVILIFMNSRKALSVIVTLVATSVAAVIVLVKRYNILEVDLEKSTDSRLKMWSACLKLIKERPLFGYGAGSQSTALGLKQFNLNKPHAHSLYFEMTTELGFVGIIFLAVVFALILYDVIKLIRHGGIYTKLGIAFLAVIASFLVASLTEFTLQTPKELQYFMLALGMLEAAKRLAANDCLPVKKEKPDKGSVKVPAVK